MKLISLSLFLSLFSPAFYSLQMISHRDSSPANFLFTELTDVALNTEVKSSIVQISGINVTVSISIVNGGEYRVCLNGSSEASCDTSEHISWTNSPGNVSNGQFVQVRLNSSPSFDTQLSTTLLVGTGSADFLVTTYSQAKIAYADSVSTGANLSSYSFTNLNGGPEAPDRHLIVFVGVGDTASTIHAISSVQIFGQPGIALTPLTSGYDDYWKAQIFIAHVPTGSIGTVNVSMNKQIANIGISIHQVTGLQNPTTLVDSSAQFPYSTWPHSHSLDVAEGGVTFTGIFVFTTGNATSVQDFSWNGVTNYGDSYSAEVSDGLAVGSAGTEYAVMQTAALDVTGNGLSVIPYRLSLAVSLR